MHNELFSLGPLTFHTYGLMIALGILSAYGVAIYRAKRMNIDTTKLDTLIFSSVLCGILGAKVLYWITIIKDIIKDPSLLLNFSDGFVVYGGIIAGILCGYIYCKIHHLNFLQHFDLIIPSVALAQAFGRIGCFFAGCCYGMETTCAIGVQFPDGSLAPSGVDLLPTQLFSSALDFLHFLVLILIARKKKFDGQIAAFYLIFYSIGRFVLEFFRGDLARGSVGTISTSQFISIFMFAFGCLMLLFLYMKSRRAQSIQ